MRTARLLDRASPAEFASLPRLDPVLIPHHADILVFFLVIPSPPQEIPVRKGAPRLHHAVGRDLEPHPEPSQPLDVDDRDGRHRGYDAHHPEHPELVALRPVGALDGQHARDHRHGEEEPTYVGDAVQSSFVEVLVGLLRAKLLLRL
ncbi:unnamed protein product [Clonostachys rosea f. rosea IK726]|uniref:Uncharacterized protein n=1 Tax=Clonostachys rosea f. rosea IK726 TaxID=1349383 RepID=A0ACA9UT01_BIOOC|nr:unnamed protein product [Clonostachys rosea f. rosea IK726]